MLRDGVAIGNVLLRRPETGPFSPRQIALLESFAAQAVIAIENVRLFTELREALDQQTATADILRVIAQSPTDVAPVLEAVSQAALRFCGAQDVAIDLREGTRWRCVAHAGILKSPVGMTNAIGRQDLPGRTMLDRAVTQIPDVEAATGPETEFDRGVARQVGFRAALAAPMMRQDEAAGAIILHRTTPGAFSERQIALLESFAAQAVIALENTRLFTELQKRTDDLTESLDYQTATSELLEVISRSATDIRPVFDSMLASAARLCGVAQGDIAIRHGEAFRYAASIGPSEDELEWLKARALLPGRTTTAGRALLERQVVQTLDQSDDPELRHPDAVKRARTVLAAPLLRDGEAIGVITLLRDRVEAFSERQVALIRTFADQAVIAMENARLLGELRQRTDDLTESLEYQTATSEVLAVISRSPADLQPVLEAMTAAAVRLCGVRTGGLSVRRGESLHFVALVGQTPEFERWQMSAPIPIARGVPLGDAILDKQPVQIVDVMDTEAYKAGAEVERAVVDLGLHRTVLHVPLLRDDEAVGVLTVSRSEPQAFTERQIGLIETFADQAVIAMENARLLSELTRREEELRVTFDHMGDGVVMFDAELRLASWNRNFQQLLDIPDAFLAARPGLEDYVRLLVARGELGHGDPEGEIARHRERVNETWSIERTRPDGRILEVRNNPVPGGGAVLIYGDVTERKEAEAEIRAARDAAEAALDKLKAAQANLVQSEKMASLGQLTAGIAHEIKNPLNFVNNFATLSVELLDELKEVAGPALATLDEDKRAELDETMELLTGNLGKIAEHGKRADGIVRSMLSHSRGGSGDWAASDVNALVEEALNLAYHGARAQDKEFNVTLERDFEKGGKPIEVVPQDVTRVFLNLFGNGFYAVNKRRATAKDGGFRPTLKVMTRDLGDRVEVRVRDNGTGIPPEVREKLFQPFFTTKPTGEGTGLGLSISYDIVTQQHGGTIEVESEPGRFTEFTVRLPRSRRVSESRRGS
ncbi:MAG: GAF domain-containing protein, partial [Alphaproteobacteria bacterium]|nr:GAF domain-containing protein [Alphaproteobacteria bacterium]